ncbi:NAD(P)/FAD-dependent oxidoreductase [Sphingobium sp. 3R8]|uniref:flavin-containing monooxygenase n=1 Tax=Sphingobium sp. 3R8 TaxID=2874921 RepID=UPI001CC98777|nr:NAD(P)/FAD-dependent oxidoreductase [Sphingobium sp. 3R8]MBZ9646894.1 NAD(P)/FAD-dependent oxidoreductase [Sphingobium sp. 3R8]
MTDAAMMQIDKMMDVDFDVAILRARYRAERDRRVKPEGNGQYFEAAEGLSHFAADPWADADFARAPVSDHTEVIVVGGGFGGLLMGARLREAGITDVRLIEEAGDFGGTWYWNRYPGAMCDIESLLYLPLLEEMEYVPKHKYAVQPEILEHCRNIGSKYGLYDKALFKTTIADLRWSKGEKQWHVATNRGDKLTASYVVLACGRQSLPKLPGIRGISTFKGHMFHSSRWDYDYTQGDSTGHLTGLKDKRVAIVGTGATAIQIVPHLGEWSKELYVFQRTPSSVGVRANADIDSDWAKSQKPGWQRDRMSNFTSLMAGAAPDVDLVKDGWTKFAQMIVPPKPSDLAGHLGREPSSEEIAYAAELADFKVMNELRDRISEVVEDPDTAEKLKPWYRWACKRPCFHDDYLATFNRPNVHLIDTFGQGVEAFTETGIVVNGEAFDVDCVVFATGFEAGISYTHLTGFEIFGRGGLPLSQHWKDGVRTLHGLSTDNFPNLFFMGGNPQTTAAVNAVHLLDEQSRHIGYILKTARDRNAATVESEREAAAAWAEGIRTSPKNQAQFQFYAECTPGYYNNEGKAKTSADLFQGGRYGDGPAAYFALLNDWREKGDLSGLSISPEHEVAEPYVHVQPADARSQ